MSFTILRALLEFEAIDPVILPKNAETNVFRGALGNALRSVTCNPTCRDAKTCPVRSTCPYACFFEPIWPDGPSGYREAPRPFVLRSPNLADPIPTGATLHTELFLFVTHNPPWAELLRAFALAASQGLGPTRARARMKPFQFAPPQYQELSFPIEPPTQAPSATIRLRFATPIELKGDGEISQRPDFPLLAHRLLDRIWALGSRYQSWPSDWDARPLLDLAFSVRLLNFDWRHQEAERRSSRTGQRHSLGGYIGWADYQGPIAAFLPFLEIARFTGVGRQTVWGKGQILIERSS